MRWLYAGCRRPLQLTLLPLFCFPLPLFSLRSSGPQDKLTEKYSSAAVGGDDNVNLFQMLIQHPFNTEPNDSVVLADQNKQVSRKGTGGPTGPVAGTDPGDRCRTGTARSRGTGP